MGSGCGVTSYPVPGNASALVAGSHVASWNHLHAIPRAVLDPDDEDTVEALCGGPWPVRKALCGCTAEWTMPGVFSRMGMDPGARAAAGSSGSQRERECQRMRPAGKRAVRVDRCAAYTFPWL